MMDDFIKLVVAGGSTSHTNQPTAGIDQFQVRITVGALGGVKKTSWGAINKVFNPFQGHPSDADQLLFEKKAKT